MAIVDPRNPESGKRSRDASASRIDWPAALAEHGRWLRTVALARVGEPQAADEVLQNVAVTAIEHGNRLRDSTKVAPWLYRLAVVAALQYRRRQGRGRKLLDRYATRVPPTDVDADEPDPLDWLLVGEQRKLVRSALRQLPRRDAEILILKYTEDWSYRQLAEHLGLTTSAVEARLHRARRKMRTLLVALDPSLAAANKF
ncbi:MAG TPA: sigma-70 family RNA polymerase sigma factor [Lacipirellulaceae bacterium]|jgi:RNA polymerase sigma-70 factor (ECF subfamily)